jgi:hypothetical protein
MFVIVRVAAPMSKSGPNLVNQQYNFHEFAIVQLLLSVSITIHWYIDICIQKAS